MKVLASLRVHSSRSPDTDYEILHVENDGHQSVVVRLHRGEEILPAEIHVDDLAAFGAEWDRFVKEVLRRSGAKGPPISIERKPPEVPYIPVRKVKKTGALSPPAAAAAAAPAPVKIPQDHDVIAFQLSTPPTADSVMATVMSQPGHLVVVTPFAAVGKVEDYLASLKTGLVTEPTTFRPIVVRRPSGPQSMKKLTTDIAGGISRMLGEPGSVLWILPEA